MKKCLFLISLAWKSLWYNKDDTESDKLNYNFTKKVCEILLIKVLREESELSFLTVELF